MQNKYEVLVLLSGGIDSSTALGLYVDKYGPDKIIALSLTYGQKHEKEREAARAVAKHYDVELIEEDLSAVFKFDKSSALLKGSTEEMPMKSYAEQLEEMGGSGIVKTYVPFRNGLFLSYATAVALQLGAKFVCYGAHTDDAAGGAYPDCTPEFVHSMHAAIIEGTATNVGLLSPFIDLNKMQIVKRGIELDVPYGLTWSCYSGGESPCMTCGTCLDRAAAFKANFAEDPLLRS